MRRKPNADERRRDLCDVAIALLADGGARGLTHLRVDRAAGVADGTTSFYFQTRAALLRGVTDRVVSQDLADFTAAMEAVRAIDAGDVQTLLAQLAEQAMRTGVEPERSRARARFELMMLASRDADLGAVFAQLMTAFTAIGEEAVARAQPTDRPVDRDLVSAQAIAVITFLGGFLFRLANGVAEIRTAEQLEGYLHAMISGVAAEHHRIRASGGPLSRRKRG